MAESTESKRLFVGGLFPDINEGQLKERFGKFGEITAVEIKSKATVQGDKPNTFAFIDIKITPNNLVKCFSVFSNCRWKGYEIKLQVAKESFLERLKKEKEGFAIGGKPNNPNFEPLKDNKLDLLPEKIEKRVKKEIKTKIESSPASPAFDNHSRDRVKHSQNMNFPKEDKQKDLNSTIANRHKFQDKPVDVIERLEKFSSSVWNDNPGDSNSIKSLSNEKRLKSIQENLQLTKSREKLVSESLKLTVNSNASKKRHVFVDEDETDSLVEPKVKLLSVTKSNSRRKSLFDDSEESEIDEGHDSERFDLKPQFHGESGQKLLDLQSKFNNDARFRLDKRFAEDDDVNTEEVDDIKAEKNRNLEILESIVGGSQRKKRPTFGLVRRYDPSKKSCVQLEIHHEEAETSNIITTSSTTESVAADVSKERFYHVNSNLASLFKSKEKEESSFSLLQAFSSNPSVDPVKIHDKKPIKEKKIKYSRTSIEQNRNPFIYDSSSDEESEKKPQATTKSKEPQVSTSQKPKFLFSNSDQRFKEGTSFFKKSEDNKDKIKWMNRKERVTKVISKNRKQQLRNNNKQIQALRKKKRKMKNPSKSRSK